MSAPLVEKSKNCLSLLPNDCTEKILGFTSPLDVCRFSLVSKSLQSAAESDSVWEKFLPSDLLSIISASLTLIPDFASKKDLYVYLCHNPILIDAARKRFSLEKWSGKKCYFLGARDLNIAWGETPECWKWTSLPDSRFPEVAKLNRVWCLYIQGTIRAGVLSPRTSYAAYLVYKFEDEHGFHLLPSDVSVGVFGVELEKRLAFLVPEEDIPQQYYNIENSFYTLLSNEENDRGLLCWLWQHMHGNDTRLTQSIVQRPKLRDDGWFEVELGEFYTENEDDCIEMNLSEMEDSISLKRGLIVEGIEIRPRMG